MCLLELWNFIFAKCQLLCSLHTRVGSLNAGTVNPCFLCFVCSNPTCPRCIGSVPCVPSYTLSSPSLRGWLEVCVPKLVLNETRLELISRISGTGTRLMFSGLVTQENLGKIREINMTRRDYSIPYRKFPNSTEFQDSSQKTSIIDLNYHI